MTHAGVLQNRRFPVEVRICNRIVSIVLKISVNEFLRESRILSALRVACIIPWILIEIIHIIEYTGSVWREFCRSYHGYLSVVADLQLSFRSLLCRNENYARCGTCTIDGGRSGILQHGNLAHILSRNIVQTADGHTVHKDKRAGVRHCSNTSDLHSGTCTRHAAWTGHAQSRNDTLKRLGQLGSALLSDDFIIDNTYRSGKVLLFHWTITDYDGLFQFDGILGHNDIERILSVPHFSLRKETHEREFECLALLHILDSKISVQVCGRPFSIVLIQNHRSGYRSVRIADSSFQDFLSKSPDWQHQSCHYC